MQERIDKIIQEYRQRYTTPNGTTVRFRLKLPKEEAEQLLGYIYQDIVTSRGMDYCQNEQAEATIRKTAQWLCDGKRMGLMVNGGVGTGKTTLLKAISRLLSVTTGVRTIMCSANDIISRELGRISAQTDTDSLRDIPVLFIDDLGTEAVEVSSYKNEYSPIIELLSIRYERQSPTLITTNLTRDKFEDRYGERVADRSREMFDWLSFKGQSFRK